MGESRDTVGDLRVNTEKGSCWWIFCQISFESLLSCPFSFSNSLDEQMSCGFIASQASIGVSLSFSLSFPTPVAASLDSASPSGDVGGEEVFDARFLVTLDLLATRALVFGFILTVA